VASLYDYVASLKVGSHPVVWSNRPLTKGEVDASAGRPYVRVEEVGQRIDVELYGYVEVVEVTVDVFLYQAPSGSSVMPNRSSITKLFFDVCDAVHHVDSWTYGQPLIDMFRDFTMAPNYDDDTGGLLGLVRFRLLTPRG
jgi:hypothetical protein